MTFRWRAWINKAKVQINWHENMSECTLVLSPLIYSVTQWPHYKWLVKHKKIRISGTHWHKRKLGGILIRNEKVSKCTRDFMGSSVYQLCTVVSALTSSLVMSRFIRFYFLTVSAKHSNFIMNPSFFVLCLANKMKAFKLKQAKKTQPFKGMHFCSQDTDTVSFCDLEGLGINCGSFPCLALLSSVPLALCSHRIAQCAFSTFPYFNGISCHHSSLCCKNDLLLITQYCEFFIKLYSNRDIFECVNCINWSLWLSIYSMIWRRCTA